MSGIDIEIDGRPLKATPNSMVIQVADEAGIYIPRFCYHKHLSIAANCRMCLVEVEKSPKTLPACATPVAPGMKIFTRSPKALAAQKAVMEFLLINHPLDCPICDQGGECELQDLSLGFGAAFSNYKEGKRSVKDPDLGPLVATDMTRCIHCTRCVRFGQEIAGLPELGAVGRNEHMEIGTYVEKTLHSEVSGNIIDLCPVGALTSKPFRFKARPWELSQFPTISPHDCLGSNVYVHTRDSKVMRVVPRENLTINETWISDRDRFSYEGLSHVDRIGNPLIRKNGRLQETDWQTALLYGVERLQGVLKSSGAEQVGALASPQSTLEEFYLLQKLLRQLGSSHIDHRLRQVDFRDQEEMPIFPMVPFSLADLEQCDVILLIGSHIQKEQPLAALRVQKAVRKGAHVIAINMMDYAFHFTLSARKICAPHDFVAGLSSVAHALMENEDTYSNSSAKSIADLLREGKKIAILLGAPSFQHPEASSIRKIAGFLAKTLKAELGFLTEGPNAAGAWLAGAVPHRKAAGEKISSPGLDAKALWHEPRKAYLLLNVEPDLDCADPVAAQFALESAECVISLSSFNHPLLTQYADVVLPMAAFAETGGTFINGMGEWQPFQGACVPFGESRPGWKILRVLGNLLQCEGFEYHSVQEIAEELKGLSAGMSIKPYSFSENSNSIDHFTSHSGSQLTRIGEIPIYAGDSLVRRAKALQSIQPVMEGEIAAARVHPATAEKLHLQENDSVKITQLNQSVVLPLVMDDRVPEQAVYIAAGIRETSSLRELFGTIGIEKV